MLLPTLAQAQEVNYKKKNYINIAMHLNVGPSAGYIREFDDLAFGVQYGINGSDDARRQIIQGDVYYSLPFLLEGERKPWCVKGGLLVSQYDSQPSELFMDFGASLGYRIGYQNEVIGANYMALEAGVISSTSRSENQIDGVLFTVGAKWCFGL